MYIRLLFLLLISLFVPVQSMVQVYPHPETMSETALKKLHASHSSIESMPGIAQAESSLYDHTKMKEKIAQGSFYDLCRIIKKQLSYASYCNRRISFDADSYIANKSQQKDPQTQIFWHYVSYKNLLHASYEHGNVLIDHVHTYMTLLLGLLQEIDVDEDVTEYYAKVQAAADRLAKHQVAAQTCYENLVKLHKSEEFDEHMHDLHATAQTWFTIFEGYREALDKVPEKVTWGKSLEPYYYKLRDKITHLNKTLSQQGTYIQKDLLPVPEHTMAFFLWEHIFSNAYHNLDEILKKEYHPFAVNIKEDESDSLGGKIKFVWDEAATPLAEFLNDIGYFPYHANPYPIICPTIESFRELVLTFAERFDSHFKHNIFKHEISQKKSLLIKIFQVLRTSKAIPVYKSIKYAEEIVSQQPTLLTLPSSCYVTPGPSFTLSPSDRNTPSARAQLQHYDSDFDTGDAEADKFIIGEYETAHGKRAFEELQKSKLWAENLFNSDKDSQKEINPPNSNAL